MMYNTQTKTTLRGERCQCQACGEYFSTTANFDRHRRGKANMRHCVDPASVGLEIKERSFGTFWAMPGPK